MSRAHVKQLLCEVLSLLIHLISAVSWSYFTNPYAELMWPILKYWTQCHILGIQILRGIFKVQFLEESGIRVS